MPVERNTPYWNIDRIVRLVLTVTGAALLIMLLRSLSNVLLPFFVACFIAYLLQPAVDFNRRLTRSKGRVLPAILTVVDIIVVVGLVFYLFLPSVIRELDMLGGIMQEVSSGKVALPPLYRQVADYIERYFDPDNIRSILSGEHLMTIINGGSSILEESFDIVLAILSWLLTIIYLLFVLIDYDKVSNGFKLIVPYKYRGRFLKVFAEVSRNMNRYFRGQGLVALCATILYCIGFSIVGLPLALPMGLLVGVLYMIPYFQYVTLVPVAAICFVYSLGGDVSFLSLLGKCGLVYLFSQSICDYIITPHVMGREMGLSPAMILLSLSVWGSLLGIIGMIIALPVTSLIITYYRRYISEPPAKRTDDCSEK